MLPIDLNRFVYYNCSLHFTGTKSTADTDREPLLLLDAHWLLALRETEGRLAPKKGFEIYENGIL